MSWSTSFITTWNKCYACFTNLWLFYYHDWGILKCYLGSTGLGQPLHYQRPSMGSLLSTFTNFHEAQNGDTPQTCLDNGQLPPLETWFFFCTFISTFKRSSCITYLPQALLMKLSFGFFSAKMKKWVLQFSLSEQYFSHSEAFSVALFLNSHPIFIILLKTQTSQETPAETAIPFCSSSSSYHQ